MKDEIKRKYYARAITPSMQQDPINIRDPGINNEQKTMLLLNAILQEIRILNRREEKRAQYQI